MVAAFDLGMTTGVALLTNNYGLRASEAISVGQLTHALQQAREYDIVIEAPLIIGRGSLARDMEDITFAVRKFLDQHVEGKVCWCSPSQWKPTPAYAISVPQGLTQHERDAIRIGAWYLHYVLKSGSLPSMIVRS